MAFDKQTGKEAGKKSKRGADNLIKRTSRDFSGILENNADNIQKWFDEVANDNSAKGIRVNVKNG